MIHEGNRDWMIENKDIYIVVTIDVSSLREEGGVHGEIEIIKNG